MTIGEVTTDGAVEVVAAASAAAVAAATMMILAAVTSVVDHQAVEVAAEVP